ncbi:MAG: DUF488 domain-containing protein [Planctomycetaceae bacterium]|nr:DUF488 domain-containing protein [Planctomycetaceae bacterium]
MKNVIFTIGHSTHPLEKFLGLLRRHGISVICDVRSSPYSRFNPQYNKDALSNSLRDYGIKYVFLGKELGARSNDPVCYSDGRVQYDVLAETELFQNGIERIRLGIDRGYKMALMCAEKDPLDCHRTVLVARNLESEGFSISHILSDGSLETQDEATARLIKGFNLDQNDLFLSAQDVTDKAFLKQEEKIAYTETGNDTPIARRAT